MIKHDRLEQTLAHISILHIKIILLIWYENPASDRSTWGNLAALSSQNKDV